jgi:hypothetical protein
MTTTLPASLAAYSDDELERFYGASTDDGWHAVLEAEIERRAEAPPARQDPRAGTRAEWERMAHAQLLDAERVTRGELLNARGVREHVDPWTLWSGPAHRVGLYASEELRNYWLASPRIDISTYQRQAAGEHRAWIDRHDREAGNDHLGQHAGGSVRQDASQGQQRARIRGDGRGNDVPGSPARGVTQGAPAGAGTARPGGPVRRGGSPVSDDTRTAVQELRERAEAIRAQTAPGTPLRDAEDAGQVNDQPRAREAPGTGVAVREGVVVSPPLIDGGRVFRYIYTFLKRFADWNSEAEIVTVALWIMATHARTDKGYPVWQYCARLAILGPSGSGKSWKSRLIGKLSWSGEILIEPTAPAFIDLCADNHTIVLTEADEAFRSPGRSRKIVAVANASYEPDRTSSRKQGGVAVKIPLFCHLVLDGIDDVLLSPNRPDLRPLMSRCILVRSRQAAEGYRPERFDGPARATAEQMSLMASAWAAQEVAAGMADTVPEVPGDLGNRPYALWEPLFTVALHADEGDPDGPISVACREACEVLEAGAAGLPEPVAGETELDRQMAEWGYGEG